MGTREFSSDIVTADCSTFDETGKPSDNPEVVNLANPRAGDSATVIKTRARSTRNTR